MKLEDYKKYLFQPKTDKYALISFLKQEGDIDKILKIYKNISSHPFIKSLTKANIQPLTFRDIRKDRILPYSANLIGEIAWLIILFEENQGLIQTFISLKHEFDLNILLGDYAKAENILESIEKKTGKSIWLIENRLILKEYQIGVKANWEIVSDLSREVDDPFLLFFIENLSKRTESKISFTRYRNIFNNQINEFLINKELFEYLYFRLNYTAINNYESLAYFISVENGSSIIDRYLLLRNIIVELFGPRFQEYQGVISIVSQRLKSIFPEDLIWRQFSNFFKADFHESFNTDEKILALLDEYCRGNYQYCISNAKKLLKEHPDKIEIYDIYVKSIIEENLPFENLQISELVDLLLESMYNIYTNSNNIDQAIDIGYKISTIFSSTSWARQFQSFVIAATNSNSTNKLFTLSYILFSQIRNPRFLYYLQNDVEIKSSDYFEQGPGNLTVDLISDIIQGNDELIRSNFELPQKKRELYVGRALIKRRDFLAAKTLYETLKIDDKRSVIAQEEIIVNLFRCYLKLNRLVEACQLFVSNFLSNKQITKRLNKAKLLNILDSIDDENISGLIEVPIFFSIASDDPYQQYVAYDNYLENMGLSRPTDLISNEGISNEKLIFFLREVCTIEVMHHSYHFNGTDDIEDERLKILNSLIVIDKLYEDDYINEIAQLSQTLNIRKAMREVNKGRISVNVQQLRNIESTDIKEAFSRYKEVEKYSKSNELVGIDTSLNIVDDLNRTLYDELVTNKIIYTNDPAFISFKVIFIEIRDKFLFSKEYGLDGYLSTRIRHGTLLNHIRSVFESQNIISQRDKHNNYLDNIFWDNNIPYHLLDKKDQIQGAIKIFSKSIDEYTEYIVKELVQIKTEKHNKKPYALFDFNIGNKELAFLFSIVRENIKDYNIFIGFVFEYLQEFTEKTLTNIRSYLTKNIKEHYNKLLQDFSIEIKSILGNSTFPELMSSISFCGTRLQKEIETISEWFYLSGTSKDLVLDLKVLIQTAVQITNTIYPNHRITPQIIENYDFPMVGTVHLIYICRILLDNIIIHSKLSPNEQQVEIECTVTDDQYLKLSFKNNFSTEINSAVLDQKLSAVKEKWELANNSFENIDVEGGSGFDKIGRIIAFDLSCNRYLFEYYISENELTINLYIDFLNVPKYEELKNDTH
ncbi:hypothetical protein [Mucilaginibacter sp. NFR10]|uniref:hypothetical protein n=1 Tax=Mucilaginibacter sp. NFR10 TaxID=1566292 RepID=UPI0008714F3F|nr:hypothetical protein [Mucilaginibacter sp. NFR10]SCW88817.1 hypothetical protein SAMN03159284_05443 [Mucilaginibacter sp. NFR10]